MYGRLLSNFSSVRYFLLVQLSEFNPPGRGRYGQGQFWTTFLNLILSLLSKFTFGKEEIRSSDVIIFISI